MGFNIAIDGPAGAGKSTVAKIIAKKLGYIYIDTGAMYRAMALYILRKGIDASDSEKISSACADADITITYDNGEQTVWLNGENVNGLIRTEEVGKMASVVSANRHVRTKLVELQQALASKESVVMDGRDIANCVLPNADVKVFLTADSRVRAMRRYKELTAKGEECDLDEIQNGIIERDNQDMNREISPLVRSKDAVLVDSSDMTTDEVVDNIISLCNKRM